MTVLVVAPERTASHVADTLSDRELCVTSALADARDRLADGPVLVLVAARLADGTGTDLLAAVRSGEHCTPDTPVLELADTPGNADADAEAIDDESSHSSGTDPIAFDARVSLADPDAVGKTVRLAVAVSEYRAATSTLYERSRRRADGDPVDSGELDDARRAANDRLTAVQRAADGRTPFRRLLSE